MYLVKCSHTPSYTRTAGDREFFYGYPKQEEPPFQLQCRKGVCAGFLTNQGTGQQVMTQYPAQPRVPGVRRLKPQFCDIHAHTILIRIKHKLQWEHQHTGSLESSIHLFSHIVQREQCFGIITVVMATLKQRHSLCTICLNKWIGLPKLPWLWGSHCRHI